MLSKKVVDVNSVVLGEQKRVLVTNTDLIRTNSFTVHQ